MDGIPPDVLSRGRAADGIIDSKTERFEVALDGLGPGEHLIVVRAYDAAGNAGLVKVVVR